MMGTGQPDIGFVSLWGEYDCARIDELNEQLSKIKNADIVLIDMRDVAYADSSALTCLIRLKKHMAWNRGPGAVRLIGCTRAVRRAVEVTGLDGTFEMYGSVKDALGNLGYLRCVQTAG
ncbi:MAG TPA: STAS domain-containing protein [Candidatus Baltobacteraceae bacterium]